MSEAHERTAHERPVHEQHRTDAEIFPPEEEAEQEAAAEEFAHAAEEEPALDAESDEAAAQVEIDLDLARGTVERERDEYLESLRRLQADFENYKKRVIRQQSELLDRAGETLVEKLLPVLDAIDLARQHNAGEGVEQIATALIDALEKEGLERLDPVGEAFDPTEHEAVVHQPAEDGAEPTDGQVVAASMRAGYRWKGKLIRAAMVAVRG